MLFIREYVHLSMDHTSGEWRMLGFVIENHIYNIIQLLGCISWDHAVGKNNFPLNMGFPIYGEHSWCKLWSFREAYITFFNCYQPFHFNNNSDSVPLEFIRLDMLVRKE